MAKLTGFNRVAVIEMGTGYARKDYHYALYDNEIAVGDKVLLTGMANSTPYAIKAIITPDEATEIYKKDITAEVICKVDTTAYDKRVADRAEKEKIKKKMDAMIKKMDEAKKYEVYAAENAELGELLKKYKELEG